MSEKGHIAHTKPADSQEGLRGQIHRTIHITFLGAGSGFCPNLCRDAIMLNYAHPMSMLVLSAGRAVPEVNVVGLCHSVQGTSHLLANYANVPYEELQWECAGINHLAWFTTLRHNGNDLYTTVL